MDPPAQHESEMVLYIPPSESGSQKSESLHNLMSSNSTIMPKGGSDLEHVSPPNAVKGDETVDLLHCSSTQSMLIAEQKQPTHSVFQDIVDEFNESSVLAGALVPVDQDETQEQRSYTQGGRELTMKEYTTKAVTKYDVLTGFDHCFVKVPWKERLSVLFATLRRSSDRKVVVIFSSWESCQFHTILFKQLETFQLFNLHENVDNVAQSYVDFTYFYPGILFASEIALREFDIPPNVDYVIQYEPPSNPTEYICRMNTAKICTSSSRMALLFLTSEEMMFLEYFDDDTEIKELEGRKISEIQRIAVKLVSKHDELNDLASNAFRSFMVTYKNHDFSDIYDYTKIPKSGVRFSFGEPHLPDELVKYFDFNQGTETGLIDDKTQSMTQQPHQWMKKEKTWRKGHNMVLEDDHAQMQHQWMKKEKTQQKGGSQVGDGDRGGRTQKQYPWLVKRHSSTDDIDVVEGQKPHQWMKNAKSWRSGQSKQQWMSKDEKAWKYTHKNL